MSLHAVPDDASDATPPETSALVARASEGDPEARNALAAMYGRRLYALARSRLRDDQLAEDIAQSVFVTLAEKLKGPEKGSYIEQGRFESWLFRVAMNRVRDAVRKRARRNEVLSDAPAQHAPATNHTPTQTFTQPEELDALRGAMQKLSGQDREIVELRHHAGLSFKQIAATLDEPVGTVLARHHRALRKLRELIEASGRSHTQQVSR